jgi:hypothetical protein
MDRAGVWVTRFWAKVNKVGPVPPHRPELGPCWVWIGARHTRKGQRRYGHVSIHGVVYQAHRVSFLLQHGRWPEPQGLHRCDNMACVRPSHLFEGTNDDNNADMMAKGRHVAPRGDANGSRLHPERRPRFTGETNPVAVLTDAAVMEIRARYSGGEATQRKLAMDYGVSQSTVSLVVNRKHWTHIA